MRKKKVYHVNRRKKWQCPYFKWDGPASLSCDCGKPAFPSRDAANDYMTVYCAGCWEACSLAKAWNQYAEEKA